MANVGGEWKCETLKNGDLVWTPVDEGAKQICKERGIPYQVLMKNDQVKESLPAINQQFTKQV